MKNRPSFRPRTVWLTGLAAGCLALVSCVSSAPIGDPAPLAAADGIRAEVAAARNLRVHEGLPHQKHEAALLQRELERPDVTRIAGWPFYTPGSGASHPEVLRRLLADTATYGVYSGPKTCGGFHPDYAVTWESGGATRALLVCFGCGEALVVADGRSLPYDLRQPALGQLLWVLQRHDRKRPRP